MQHDFEKAVGMPQFGLIDTQVSEKLPRILTLAVTVFTGLLQPINNQIVNMRASPSTVASRQKLRALHVHDHKDCNYF